MELQNLMNDISEWSDKTFGDGQRNPAIVYHLKKEVDELIEGFKTLYNLLDNPSMNEYSNVQIGRIKMEYADCLMLLLDSVHHFDITSIELLELVRIKLEINKKRKWGIPDENGVVEHLEE